MAKIVVTGGSGFIGSHVVDALVNAGHKVTVVDYRVQPHRSDVCFENVDLMDLSSVLSATRGAEHVFHLAAVSNVNYAYKYPVYTTALNVVGTANVLEAARINGATRVYMASTVWVYNGSPNGNGLDEKSLVSLGPGGDDGLQHEVRNRRDRGGGLYHEVASRENPTGRFNPHVIFVAVE